METEIEAKFTSIDTPRVRSILGQLGATQEHAEVLMRRRNFDYPDDTLDKINGWIRLRDEGDKVTLSYKQLNDRTLHGTKEVTVIVDSFNKAEIFLVAIGMKKKAYQETKRERWKFGNVEITIDTWPWVPTFIELEAPTEEELKSVAEQLGLDWEKAMHGSVETVYQMHYDFTEKEIDHWGSITFTDPPNWLLARKKNI